LTASTVFAKNSTTLSKLVFIHHIGGQKLARSLMKLPIYTTFGSIISIPASGALKFPGYRKEIVNI
jgi:hypothetical protein